MGYVGQCRVCALRILSLANSKYSFVGIASMALGSRYLIPGYLDP